MLFKALLFLSLSSSAVAQLRVEKIDVLESQFAQRNYVVNPSAVKNTAGTSVSSATLTRDTTIGTRIDGTASFACDTSALNGYCEWSINSIPNPDSSGNCEVRANILGDASLLSLRLTDGVSTTLQDLPLGNYSSYTPVSINYPCGATRGLRLVQTTAGTTPAVNIGRIYYGRATNLGTVAQAEFVGSAEQSGATNCQFTQNTSTALTDFVDLGTAPSCAQAWSVTGSVVATGATSHTITINNMRPGTYLIQLQGIFYAGTVAAGIDGFFRIHDGTSALPGTSAANSERSFIFNSINSTVTYTTTATRTFRIQASDNGVAVPGVYNDSSHRRLLWTVYRFPSQSEIAVRSDQALDTLGSVFYVAGSQCPVGSLSADGSAVSRTVYGNLFQRLGTIHGAGDGSTTFNLPDLRGIFVRGTGSQTVGGQVYSGTLGTKQTDQFQGHEHNIQARQNNVGTSGTHSYQAGTDVVARNTAGIISDGVNGTPRVGTQTHPANIALTPCISVSTQQAPLLVGSVTSNSAGLERVERVTFAQGSISTACTVSPCTTYSESGDWVSSVVRNSTGDYTVNFNSGIFSAAPVCIANADFPANRPLPVFAFNVSTSSARFFSFDHVATAAARDSVINIICMGPR